MFYVFFVLLPFCSRISLLNISKSISHDFIMTSLRPHSDIIMTSFWHHIIMWHSMTMFFIPFWAAAVRQRKFFDRSLSFWLYLEKSCLISHQYAFKKGGNPYEPMLLNLSWCHCITGLVRWRAWFKREQSCLYVRQDFFRMFLTIFVRKVRYCSFFHRNIQINQV